MLYLYGIFIYDNANFIATNGFGFHYMLQIGAFYSVNVADSWHRVQILEIKDLKVLCFYIDTGEEDWHAKTDIYVLDNKYRYVPPQVVICL